MGEFESFFGEILEEKNIIPSVSASDKVIISTEAEFGRENYIKTEEDSRKAEENLLLSRKRELLFALHKCKNIKNAQLSHINKKRSEKRKQIKKDIAEIDLRLQEISLERTQKSTAE